MHNRVRKPFVHQGVLWACVGMSNRPFECAKAYRLVDEDRFAGKATTYAEKTGDSDAARADPFGFYHGMRVTQGGRAYILPGPEAVFIAGEEQQLGLFAD